MVEVPWARKNSGFTLLFEAYSMLLIEREMPVSSVSQTMHATDPRIWRVFNHWVHTFLQTVYKFIFRHDAMVYCSFHSDGLQPPVLSPPPTLLLLLAPSQARLSSQRR
ncbi:transposase family protein [Odoribacter splanchnicus]|uniref:transposase family protein n=1 Tax=Odoribacter splanchnicus TaxID=28118 RepID=UPI00349E8639